MNPSRSQISRTRGISRRWRETFNSVSRLGVVFIAGIAAVGCGYKMRVSAEFDEACYGGDYVEHINGLTSSRMPERLHASKVEWPDVRRWLAEISARRGLRVFDYTTPGSLMVYVCHADGLYLSIESRVHAQGEIAVVSTVRRDSTRNWSGDIVEIQRGLIERWSFPVQ